MEKKPRTKKTDISLKKPIAIPPDDGTCFGKFWDMGTKECSTCADNVLCGIVFSQTVAKDKVKKAEEQYGPFLDTASLDKIDKVVLYDWVESGKTTVQELVEMVSNISGFKDNDTIVPYLKEFIKTNNLYTNNGIVWKK